MDHVPTLATRCIAFQGSRRIAAGDLKTVATQLKPLIDGPAPPAPVLLFDELTSNPIDVNWQGSLAEVLARWPQGSAQPGNNGSSAERHDPPDAAVSTPRGPGRPRLGVVAREVTLLPRHWEWLSSQPGGASVALRKLVDEARKTHDGADQLRQAREATYRFMSSLAGNEPGFEEATRALFAGDQAKFDDWIRAWPDDIRDHARRLSAAAFQPGLLAK